MKWPIVKLGTLCDLVNGKAFKPSDWSRDGLPIIRIQNLNDATKEFNYWAGGLESQVEVNHEDVLLAWSGTPGTSFGAHLWIGGHGVLNQHIFRVDLDESQITKAWAIRSINQKLNSLIDQAHGGVGLKHVTKGVVQDVDIPLPPLSEQKRIAGILDQADGLRRKRQQALALTDQFLRSTFLDLFGDPVTNPKRWPIRKFAEVCESRLGKMLDAKQQTGKHCRPYLRNLNVQWGRLDLTTMFEMDFDDEDRLEFSLQPGDVMICEGGAGVGQTAIWHDELPECYFQKSLHRVRPIPALALSEYIAYLMWMLMKGSAMLRSLSSATIPHLTGVRLKELDIPVPPVTLQQRFRDQAASLDAFRVNAQRSATETDALFNSLVQRAFRGEL